MNFSSRLLKPARTRHPGVKICRKNSKHWPTLEYGWGGRSGKWCFSLLNVFQFKQNFDHNPTRVLTLTATFLFPPLLFNFFFQHKIRMILVGFSIYTTRNFILLWCNRSQEASSIENYLNFGHHSIDFNTNSFAFLTVVVWIRLNLASNYWTILLKKKCNC